LSIDAFTRLYSISINQPKPHPHMEPPAPSSSPVIKTSSIIKKRRPRRSATAKDFAKDGSEQTLLEISDGDFLNGFAALLADQVLASRQEQEQPRSADRRFDSFSDS